MTVFKYDKRMETTQQLTILIPAYNEEDALPRVMPELLDWASAHDARILVVNDASRDRTGEILAKFAAENDQLSVITHKVNRGYGGALKTGIRAVKTPYLITLDADGQHRLQDIEPMMNAREKVDADLVVGARKSIGKTGWDGLYRSVGKSLLRATAKILVDLKIEDLNSGMKLYQTELAQKYLPLCPETMAFSDVMTLIFTQQRHLVIEEPIETLPRAAGKSTISTMTALDTLIQIFNIVMVFNPLRIFLPVGSAAIAVGVLWALPFLLMGRGLSVAALLSITVGLISILLGLIAEQLSQIRLKDLS